MGVALSLNLMRSSKLSNERCVELVSGWQPTKVPPTMGFGATGKIGKLNQQYIFFYAKALFITIYNILLDSNFTNAFEEAPSFLACHTHLGPKVFIYTDI